MQPFSLGGHRSRALRNRCPKYCCGKGVILVQSQEKFGRRRREGGGEGGMHTLVLPKFAQVQGKRKGVNLTLSPLTLWSLGMSHNSVLSSFWWRPEIEARDKDRDSSPWPVFGEHRVISGPIPFSPGVMMVGRLMHWIVSREVWVRNLSGSLCWVLR